MSSPTGTSDAEGSQPEPTPALKPVHTALIFCVVLAAVVAAVQFYTIDVNGVERMRTAFEVWRAVPPRLPQIGDPHLVPLIYTGALFLTIVGLFGLVWLAVSVRDDEAPRIRRAAVTRPWLVGLLEHSPAGGSRPALWTAATLALVALAAWQLGAFAPLKIFGVPDTFASFDHPFHIARAEALLQSIKAGESLRWVANHHGGYPAEFYPFGFAWFELSLWALGLGLLPMPWIHKIAVLILFLAPALVFRAMARRDGWPPAVALAAFALHVAVPGGMWHGGYSELVYMGLVANVSAALAVLASMVASADAFASGRRRPVALAGICAAAALWCNPRSAIGLALCVGAAWLIAVGRSRRDAGRISLQLAGVAAVAVLLAAPELVPLIRFRDLYYFVRFTEYASSLDYLTASIEAVSLPGFGLAVLGLLAAALVGRQRYITSTVAIALLAYAAITLLFAFGASALVQQLEATRLMPLQRLLTVYLAAVGLHALARTVAARMGRPSAATVLEGTAIAALLFVFLGPDRLLSFWSRGLYEVQRSTVAEMGFFQAALDIADRTAPADTAILIVGSAVSTHQQLWAPARVPGRRYFYDNWMWYWHTDHRGPHDGRYATRFKESRFCEIFTPEYMAFHGIGAVVTTPVGQAVANNSPGLDRVFGGDYGLYTVKNPTALVSFDGTRAVAATMTNHRLTAEGTGQGGEALVRHNWFPRWRATVNGRPAPVLRDDGGYIRVPIPAGPVSLVLTYPLERFDVAARLAAAGGVVFVLALVVPQRSRRRSARRLKIGPTHPTGPTRPT